MATPDMTFFTANGGRQNGGQVQIDGMPVAASFNGGGVSTFTYDIANAAEMQVLVSGGLGEAENGEPRINLVPQSGGNSVPRTGLLQRRRQVVGGEQHHPGAAGREHHGAADDHQALGRQRLAQRSGAPRPALVLRQRAPVRQLSARSKVSSATASPATRHTGTTRRTRRSRRAPRTAAISFGAPDRAGHRQEPRHRSCTSTSIAAPARRCRKAAAVAHPARAGPGSAPTAVRRPRPRKRGRDTTTSRTT